MSWRICALGAALIAAATGCGALKHVVHRRGRLELEPRGGPGPTVDVPVGAWYCAADTALTVLGADRNWSAVIALRTPWPALTREFPFDSVLRGPGSAALALRPLSGSVGPALVASSGRLVLGRGPGLSGTLEVVARGAADTLRLAGTFDARRVVAGGCPAS